MRCPACDHPEDRVIDSRPLESASVIRRRRSCLYCGRRFTTYERVEATPLMVVKRDNRREPYNREKMRAGIDHACRKRPVSPSAVEKLVADVEYSLQDFILEVPSHEIGERILKRLHALDPVAYVRFASVYRSYESIDDFQAEMRRLKKKVRQGPTAPSRPAALYRAPEGRLVPATRSSTQPLEAQHS